MSTYTVAGITYDVDTGRPSEVQQNTPLLTPNAVVGQITSESGVKYNVYSDYNQTNTQVQKLDGTVVYEGFTNVNDGNVAEGFAPSFFTEKDV